MSLPMYEQNLDHQEILQIKQPHPLSFLWWKIYFSENPASPAEEKDVYYDRQGYLHQPSTTRPVLYWGDPYLFYYGDCCYAHPIVPHHHGNGGSCNHCCDGMNDCGEILGIIILVAIAFLAVIIACAIVISYPPVMLISWTILFVGSIAEGITGTEPACHLVRIYNLVSASSVFVYFSLVSFGIYRIQRHYKGFYPGTPGIQVNYDGLVSLFTRCKKAFFVSIIPSGSLALWGIIQSARLSTFSSCPWTTVTQYGWIVVHFLNMVAAGAMVNRMEKKRFALENPPAYTVEAPPPQRFDSMQAQMHVNVNRKV